MSAPPGAESAGPPRLGVTIGDPAGIGPEIALRASRDERVRAAAHVELLGARPVLSRHAAFLGFPPGEELAARRLEGPASGFQFGRVSAACGAAAASWVEEGVRLCREGVLDGIVTAPLHKESLRAAGLPDRGHTDLLARLLGGPPPLMMFHGAGLTVALLTDHVDLRTAVESTRRGRIVERARIVAREWGAYLGRPPRLALAALNPHAGEAGIGREESEEMAPAVQDLRSEGIEIAGPLSAEHVYRRAAAGEFDVVLAPYHDQALVPLKTIAFRQTVHVTLGLPFVRTSVDHGTAFDIAGRGVADPEPMVQAVLLAASLVRARRAASAP